jgi:peptide deformylase
MTYEIMPILPLVIAPDPRLKQPSKPVEKVDDALRAFMDDMLDTMYAMNGIGLAAVQVGVHKRVLVMDLDRPSPRYPDMHHHHDGCCDHDHHHDEPQEKGKPLYLVNPEIIEESEDDSSYEEGCLSFPGQYGEVVRPASVRVKYLDYNGNAQEMVAEGLLATCLQHEMDHLNGITFVDHLSRMKRDMILRKLQKEKKK